MKHTKSTITLLAALAFAPVCQAASIMPLTPFDPYNEFTAGLSAPGTRGYQALIDFDDDGHGAGSFVTSPGFLSVPDSNSKSYSLAHGSATIDITVRNANLANQNRWRGFNARGTLAGPMMNDFEQWYGNTGIAVEATFSISGLAANKWYEVGFYQFNVGAGQTTHSFYDGTSTTDPLLGTNRSSGNQNNYATWEPGTIVFGAADGTGQIDITVQANAGASSRLTLAGLTVFAVPEPSSTALLGLGGLALIIRRRR